MFRYFLFISLILAVNIAKAQKTKTVSDAIGGIIIYHANIVINNPSNTIDTLIFNKKKSIFKWGENKSEESKMLQEIEKQYPNATLVKSFVNESRKDSIGHINLFYALKDSMYSRKWMLDQVFLIKAKKPQIRWNITDVTKKIGKFTATKATACFRGRYYTAWFTRKIPVPYGPWKLVGLPGLILQAYDKEKNVHFTIQEVKFHNIGSIDSMPLNGNETVVSLDEYKNIMTSLRKRAIKNAHKIARKFTHNNPNLEIKVKVPKTKPMEIFDKSGQKCN